MLALPLRSVASPALPNSAPPQVKLIIQTIWNQFTPAPCIRIIRAHTQLTDICSKKTSFHQGGPPPGSRTPNLADLCDSPNHATAV